MTGFIVLFDTARVYTLHITIGYTWSSKTVTVFSSRCFVASFNGECSFSSAFSNGTRPQLLTARTHND
jgi:hypothetical protein